MHLPITAATAFYMRYRVLNGICSDPATNLQLIAPVSSKMPSAPTSTFQTITHLAADHALSRALFREPQGALLVMQLDDNPDASAPGQGGAPGSQRRSVAALLEREVKI